MSEDGRSWRLRGKERRAMGAIRAFVGARGADTRPRRKRAADGAETEEEARTRDLDAVDWTVSGHLEYRERLRIQIEDGDDWRMLSG